MQNTNGWTPADYRAALDAWRAKAPANDSDIMPAPRKAKARHGSSSAKYRAILTYRDPPTSEPLSSNWRTIPANDNRPAADSFKERGIEIAPTADEMVARVAHVHFEERQEARLAGGRFEHVPAGRIDRPTGDVEWGTAPRGKVVVTRLGGLCFSNGMHTEHACRRAPGGGVEDYAARLPIGALRYSTEKQTRVLGSDHSPHVRRANLRVASWLGFHELYEPVPANRSAKRSKVKITAAERATLLAGPLPPVKMLPGGLPLATKDLGALFLSFEMALTGGTATPWPDLASRLDAATAWRHVLDDVAPESIKVLDAALEASSMEEIGRGVGASGTYAGRAGKQALEAANDDLAHALKKHAA